MRTFIIFSILLAATCQCVSAQDIDLDMVPYLSGFSSPVDIANAGDDSKRLFVVERAGKIRIVEADTIRSVDFLNIIDSVESGGERGLLGLAFHPDYENNGFFYVNYIRKSGSRATRISRFSVSSSDPNQADPESEEILLEIIQPFGNHNGGDLNFGPNDGYLYIGTGDGGSGGDPGDRAQNPLNYLGKMLRIDVDNGLPYTIPASNPFATAVDTLQEIWSTGLRNPWRFSFDRLNGNMWIADVGQGGREELDLELANSAGGINWGWRCYEGTTAENLTDCGPFEDYAPPIFEYTHSNNGEDAYGFSVTGGYVYRGLAYPDMQGWYFMADYVTNHFWAVNYDGMDTTVVEYTSIGVEEGLLGISTFGEAENGELFVALLDNGTLYQLVDLTVVNSTELPASITPAITIFPNPTDGRMTIEYSRLEATDIQLIFYNSLGEVALSDDFTHIRSITQNYDLTNYPPGIYILEVRDREGQVASKKIVVE